MSQTGFWVSKTNDSSPGEHTVNWTSIHNTFLLGLNKFHQAQWKSRPTKRPGKQLTAQLPIYYKHVIHIASDINQKPSNLRITSFQQSLLLHFQRFGENGSHFLQGRMWQLTKIAEASTICTMPFHRKYNHDWASKCLGYLFSFLSKFWSWLSQTLL